MSDLSKYCVHLLGKEGLSPVRGGFPPFQIMLCNRVVNDGSRVGIYNSSFPRYEDGSPLLR